MVHSCKTYDNLEKGFSEFYSDKFVSIFTVVSGKFWGRFYRMFYANINKIISIPYVVVFTSSRFKEVLLQEKPDEEHILSYDTITSIKDSFFNPEGVISSFKDLKNKIISFKQGIEFKIKKRDIEKQNFEGVLTFEYLKNEEDLLAPALYKEIITNAEIKEEEKINLINYFLSFKNKNLDNLFLNLKYFKNIPIEILSKYSARAYTLESDFYKTLNFDLMKSKMNNNYKTFIKILYNGIDCKSFSSFTGKVLYRGSRINKSEIEKILEYKNKNKLNNIVVFSKAFLSFSEDESKAKQFLGKSENKFIGILFELQNYDNSKQESNADIQKYSAYKNEKEILFFPGSSFIIKDISYIDNNERVKIILNYNGKFREKYNLLYGNKKKLNDLIKTNIITKSIAGKELEFLKDGKYLILERITNIKKNEHISNIMKAKNLQNNEIVFIKEIPNNDFDYEKYYNQLIYLLKELKDSDGVCSLKETFKINDSFYFVVEIYDDYLSNYLNKIKPKKLPPNLIKKIMIQFKKTFIDLISTYGERLINPSNILIKYTNENKNNFDVFLNEDALLNYEGKLFFLNYCHPDIINDFIEKKSIFTIKDDKKKIKNELFGLGINLLELYFEEFSTILDDLDCQLFNKIFFSLEKLEGIKFDPIKYKNLKESFDNFIYNNNYNDLLSIYYKEQCAIKNIKHFEMEKQIQIYSEFQKIYGNHKEQLSFEVAYLKDIRNIIQNNIEGFINEIYEKIDSNYDKLLFDLICRLIGYNKEKVINSYEEFFNHPFFKQYNY